MSPSRPRSLDQDGAGVVSVYTVNAQAQAGRGMLFRKAAYVTAAVAAVAGCTMLAWSATRRPASAAYGSARLRGDSEEVPPDSAPRMARGSGRLATPAHGGSPPSLLPPRRSPPSPSPQEQDVDAERVCLDLPGVKMRGPSTGKIRLAAGDAVDPATPEACTRLCRSREDCSLAVLDSEDGACELFSELSTEPINFHPGHNSSFCGPMDDKESLLTDLRAVYKKKPYVPPPKKCAWAGESCMDSHCCADMPVCDWQYSNCQWYTCYQKDQYFAGCKTGAAPGYWNGTKLGGHASYDVGKAPKGVLTQGTSLFCIAVVMWGAPATMAGMDSEAAVANSWKSRGQSILECEEHAFFDGLPTGSGHNIDSFTHAWDLVRKDGRWKRHDWVVKVDADAVFFPERLRWHIGSLRTPQGAAVYLRNNFFKFHFMGAIEVLTREAMALYFERVEECNTHVGKQGGEDYWMQSCLEGLGVNYQTDYDLLRDKYAAQDGCYSDWVVAFHFYKSANDWQSCHTQAQNAWNANHKNREVKM